MADSHRPKGEKLSGKLSKARGKAGRNVTGAASGLGDTVANQAAGAAGQAANAAGNIGGKLTGAAGAATGAAAGLGGKAAGGLGNAGSSLTGAAGALGKKGASLPSASLGSGKGGWRSFVPPNKHGKVPWKWRWLGLLPILLLCIFSGIWAWDKMEDGLHERAVAHLACDGVDTSNLQGQDGDDTWSLDWSYRSVTVNGVNDVLPQGITEDTIRPILENGAANTDCQQLQDAGYENGDNTGVRKVSIAAAAAAAIVAIPDPAPTATPQPAPTATPRPEPTATSAPEPTATPEPDPTPAPQIAALAATAAFDGQNIILSGEVTSEAQREALVASAIAAVGEANVTDRLTIADGEPSDTAETRVAELANAIGAFGSSNVIEGQASVNDDALTYTLIAPSDDAASALDLAGTGTISVPESPAPSFTG